MRRGHGPGSRYRAGEPRNLAADAGWEQSCRRTQTLAFALPPASESVQHSEIAFGWTRKARPGPCRGAIMFFYEYLGKLQLD